MTFVSYSQNFEDVLLWRAFSHLETGFYIDVGASHPDVDSVTRAFYDRGWHGINIEPTATAFLRLTASRPRDINLQVAVGSAPGTLPFFAVEGVDSGLSTLDAGAARRASVTGAHTSEQLVTVETLQSICQQYAPAEIHFLKIDVEGAERLVLEGADFTRYRPWVLVIEATAPMSTVEVHDAWDALVCDAGYKFVWFDGLNRFYVADEHHEAISPNFRTPPNVFDDFLRAADTEWTRRLAQAETRVDTVLSQVRAAEHRASAAQELSEAAYLRSIQGEARMARAETRAAELDREVTRLQAATNHAVEREAELRVQFDRSERLRLASEAWLDAMRRSTTWRVMGPVRRILRALGRHPLELASPPLQTNRSPSPDLPQEEAAARPSGLLLAVHQFHSGTALGDAITNAMLLTRTILRQRGYDSHIFAQHRAPELELEIHSIESLPRTNDYVLIIRHSMGHDALSELLRLPVSKILVYHNITPPRLLADTPHLQSYAIKGRQQLALLRKHVEVALADSEYNAAELREAGFTDVSVCSVLFDVDHLLRNAPEPVRGDVFTILFVGRLARSKGQLELVTAFARFRELYRGETRLILVGRTERDAYAHEVSTLIRRLHLDTGAVQIAGLVSDEVLRTWYAAADLYVSMSKHEGFGVPLAEAIAAGVPVVALASGAVPETLGDPTGLLQNELPSEVALRILALATDETARNCLARRQHRAMERYRLGQHIPTLLSSLRRIGLSPEKSVVAVRAQSASLQVTIAGHVNGTYSLAEVNRSLALMLDRARPGTVRFIPVEGDVSTDLSGVPEAQRTSVRTLVVRPPPLTRPHVIISQHYPVWTPPDRGDLCLAFFFWEESLVPAETVEVLNGGFGGVLTPSRVVAKALIDSGVTVPVRVIGYAPRLERFTALRECRSKRPKDAPFTFLHVSSAFPRKGVDVLLAAYASAFRRTDHVLLIIKVFPNPHNTTRQQIDAMRAADPDVPTVELIDRDVTEDELLALFLRANAMVLPTRGEGFNLPAAEARAAGLFLIVTGYGGHLDFLDRMPVDTVRFVDFKFARAQTHLSVPFSLWAEPDQADLAAALHESLIRREVGDACNPPDENSFAARLSETVIELLSASRRQLSIGMITTWGVPCGIAEYSRHLVAHLPDVQAIFADRRSASSKNGPAVIPCWTNGHAQDLNDLANSVVHQNCSAIVIQHQPGLILWRDLEALLALDAFHGRVVCVVLHNTRHLLDIALEERRSALRGLAMVSRVVVHTLQDVNRLLTMGLHGNVAYIPQGVPAEAGRVIPAQRHITRADPVLIGCYGFFLPGKGIDRLIEALPLLRETFPRSRLRLVNAAYPDPVSSAEIERCREIARDAGLERDIEFVTDFLDEGHSTTLLEACDIIVLPYLFSNEASSAALRSAMSAHVSIAVTPLPLFEEAGDAVYRFDGVEPSAIVSGLISLLQDRDQRTALIEAASRWRNERLWSFIGRRWHGLLSGLLASSVVIGQDDEPHSFR